MHLCKPTRLSSGWTSAGERWLLVLTNLPPVRSASLIPPLVHRRSSVSRRPPTPQMRRNSTSGSVRRFLLRLHPSILAVSFASPPHTAHIQHITDDRTSTPRPQCTSVVYPSSLFSLAVPLRSVSILFSTLSGL
ncbi:hypothetical protein B0H10DRAFT_2054024 [Mycena sp. CBHHK59/15]|nr:hypothetical protein B0H10DRAFT_2054024 [Mycena sp. CBHHK59/15]